MAPLRRADAAAEAWALAQLAPLLAAQSNARVRAVYPLPPGGATHLLLLPAACAERALRVGPDATALVQKAALRVSFLQLDDQDGTRPECALNNDNDAVVR